MPPIVRGKLNLEELQNKSACQKCDFLLFRSMQWRRTPNSLERALRPKASQSPDEADGNPVHLLRHPHSKRGAAGGLLNENMHIEKCFQGATTPTS